MHRRAGGGRRGGWSATECCESFSTGAHALQGRGGAVGGSVGEPVGAVGLAGKGARRERRVGGREEGCGWQGVRWRWEERG